MSKSHRSVASGFTLMELLIVITVIALLVSLLLPVIGMIRDSAKTAICMNAHRQLMLGVIAYSTDQRGAVPAVRAPWGGWISAITPYVREGNDTDATKAATNWKSDVAYGCPLFVRDKVRLQYASGGFFYNGIGMNGWLMTDGDAGDANQRRHTYIGAETNTPRFSTMAGSTLRIANLSRPARRIILIDNNEDWTGNAGYSGLPNGDSAQNICIWGGSTLHRGRTNAAFVDGHVATVTNGWPSQASAGIQNPGTYPE